MADKRGVNRGDTYPLSQSQLNIWSLEQAYLGTPINNICETVRIRGRFDVTLLQQTLDLLVETDCTLRTRISYENENLCQYEADYVSERFPVFDFSKSDELGLHHWEDSIAKEAMPVVEAPLYAFYIFKLGEHEGGVLIKTHHLISDGWSQVLTINKLANIYLRKLAGEEVEIKHAPSYRNHVQSEADYKASRHYQSDKDYWQKRLQEPVHPAALRETGASEISPVGQRLVRGFSRRLNHAIYNYCVENRVAPFAVFYMALALYIKRTDGAERFSIGVPIYNRINASDRETTGMFVSTLPFINRIDENWSFAHFTEELMVSWYDLLRHQRLPYDEIMDIAARSGHGSRELSHMAFSFQNSHIYTGADTDVTFSGQWNYSGYQAEQLCIHLHSLLEANRFEVNYDYLTQIFSEQDMDELHKYLTNIISNALADPDKPLCDISMTDEAEAEKVIYAFNETYSYLPDISIYRQLQEIEDNFSERAALIWQDERIKYSDLLQRAHAYSALLDAALGERQKDDVVGILLPRSAELIIAMCAITKSGRAWLILDTNLPQGRLDEILEDSAARAVIGSSALLEKYNLAANEQLALLVTDNIAETLPCEAADMDAASSAEADDTAYMIYTSGSSGKPKGVEISHRNLLNFALSMREYYTHGAVLSLTNTSFDAFLVESMAALLNGLTIVLPEEGVEENPTAMAQYISNYAVGFLTMTPARLSACLHNEDFRKAMGRVESIICGGEAFPPTLLHQLSLVTAARIYNQYGPSETTVGVSIKQLNNTSVVTAGKPMANCRLYVLDSEKKPLPCGVYGEIYIGGICVGKGYRNQPQKTEAAFSNSPFEPGERIYKTGDLGYWTENGELMLCGRKDNQVKLRGLRIELDEIAARLSLHPNVDHAIAHIFEQKGQPMIAAYYVAPGKVAERELLEIAATYLPYYMIPSVFIHINEIPLTKNGKLDTERLPVPRFDDRHDAAIGTEAESKIVAIFQEVLNNPDIDATSDYFASGGSSLNAMEILARIEEEFGVRLRVADIYACRKASRLARMVDDEAPDIAQDMPAASWEAPKRDSYPLSPIQQSLYFQTMLDPTSTSYNMPGAVLLPENIDICRLGHAFEALFAAEDIFRTSFVFEQGKLQQKIAEHVDFSLNTIEISGSIDEAAAAFVQPFNLEQAPLLRAVVVQDSSANKALLIDIHHLIGDGLSMPLLMHKLSIAYNGEILPQATHTYKDYAYQLSQVEPDKQADREYWQQTLSNLPEPLDLPTDFPRPAEFDFCGDKYTFNLSDQISKQVNAFCAEQGISPAMFFAAAYALLLSKYSQHQDIIMGLPVSARDKAEITHIIGPFINTQPLRLFPDASSTLHDYLLSTREMVLGAVDHQQLSLEELLTLAKVPRKAGGNALYQTMFSLRPISGETINLHGETLTTIPINNHTAKLELSLEAYEKEDRSYGFTFEYATSLFAQLTMAYYGRTYLRIIEQFLSVDLHTYLGDIDCLSTADRYELIEKQENTYTPFVDMPLDRQFTNIAAQKPDVTALICHGEKISYAQLTARATQIAGQLQHAGIGRGDRVALLCRRTPDMIASLLAINMAGCAYIPLSTSYPAARINYMLENSHAAFVLCDTAGEAMLEDELPSRKLVISDEQYDFIAPVSRSSKDLIHILYTSGSTGQPKGVPICHRALSNLLAALAPILEGCEGRILCSTNIIFDTFIFESLLPLAIGKTVVLADEEEMLLPWQMAELIESQDVQLMQLTPSRLQMCLGNDAFCRALTNIRQMVVAGEPLNRELISKTTACGKMDIINLYGPSEAAVYVCGGIMPLDKRPHIGRPLPNCRVYLLDEKKRRVMPTARGELYLSGVCLAEGYCNNEALTSKSFLPDPFVPGERMYKTGDLGRLMLDGNIDFLGRLDNQIKLNGQRVELDEINGAILRHRQVREAITVVMSREGSGMSLRSFIVPQDNAVVDFAELREQLEKLLPEYMLPSELISIKEFPRTASGKTDMRALQQWSSKQDETQPTAETAIKQQEEQAATETIAALKEEPVKQEQTQTISQEQPAAEAYEPIAAIKETSSVDGTTASASSSEQPAKEPASALAAPMQPLVKAASLPQRSAKSTTKNSSPLDEDALLALWQQVLERQDIDAEKSFFEQGGTSLSALNLLSLCFNAGLSMSLVQFYAAPTLQAQSKFLTSHIAKQNNDKKAIAASNETAVAEPVVADSAPMPDTQAVSQLQPVDNSVASPINIVEHPAEASQTEQGEAELLDNQESAATISTSSLVAKPDTAADKNPLPSTSEGNAAILQQTEPFKTSIDSENAVFLTGASGFFGSHLLYELCESGQQVACLIRGDQQRFADIISYYFGLPWLNEHKSQIVLMQGDVRQEDLGINPSMLKEAKAIYHSASDVRHFVVDNNSYLVNQRGTAHIINYAKALNLPLYYMSTLSVSGEYRYIAPKEHAIFTEDDHDIGQNWQENVYIRNKYQAEQLIFDAIKKGVKAKIFRLGRLGMRQRDALFQINPDGNSYYEMLRGLAEIDMLPTQSCKLPVEITAVDEAAKAVLLLKDCERCCYHVANDQIVSVAELAEAIHGKPLPQVSVEEFDCHLSEKLQKNRNLAPFTELYTRLSQKTPTIEPKVEITAAILKEKGFVWQSPICIDYSALK